MAQKRILISGASGLVGLSLALEAGMAHDVSGIVGQRMLNTDAFRVIQADLLAEGAFERILDRVQPDWVIHCAALANLEACEENPQQAWRVNAELPGRMAGECARRGTVFLHISTDAIFDGLRGAYREADLPNPLSIYASTKWEGEQAVQAANPQALIARINLFGWSLSGKRSLAEFFVNALRAGRQVKGFTDVFFCPLLVNDLAAILFEMLEKELRGLYHVFSADCVSKYEFGQQIARQFGLDGSLISPSSVAEGGLAAARAPNLTMDTSKLVQALGHELPTISDGIRRLYALDLAGYPQCLQEMQGER